MRSIDIHKRPGPTRLRRPTLLPTVVPTTLVGRCLLRLAWLFGVNGL